MLFLILWDFVHQVTVCLELATYQSQVVFKVSIKFMIPPWETSLLFRVALIMCKFMWKTRAQVSKREENLNRFSRVLKRESDRDKRETINSRLNLLSTQECVVYECTNPSRQKSLFFILKNGNNFRRKILPLIIAFKKMGQRLERQEILNFQTITTLSSSFQCFGNVCSKGK